MSSSAELEKFKKYIKVKKLSSRLSHDDTEAALITSETNIRYYTGFANSEGTLLVTRDKAFLLVDPRYGEAAQNSVTNAEVIVYEKYYKSLISLIEQYDIRDLLIEALSMTVNSLKSLETRIEKTQCRILPYDRLDKLISQQRMIKTKDEIEKIRKAQQITEEAFTELLNMVKPGVKESALAFELEFLMRKKGASGVSFDLITIAGAKTSMPHGVPGDNEIKSGDFVTFDIGAVYDGYHSDMTRTIAVGSVSDEQKEVYDTVLKAQLAGLSAVKAGVKASSVDRAARSVIEAAGYGEYFRHSTGHGVGLEIHEQPLVAPKSETILSEGMIITVEPGIYLPGKFGVRIEDMVAVTNSGCDDLAALSKELLIL